MKISVVLPAYNEEENIEELTKRLSNTFKKLRISFEIIYIIQGHHEAVDILVKLKKSIPEIKYSYYEKPLGIGKPFRIGFNSISKNTTHVLTMDGDLNHQPEELPLFLKKMKETNADIIIGSRYIKGGKMLKMPVWKKFISGTTNIIINLLFHFNVKDKTSGYRLMKREVTDNVKDKYTSKHFEFYPEFLIRAKREGFRMEEVPITFKFREHGKSKLKLLSSGFGYARMLIKVLLK